LSERVEGIATARRAEPDRPGVPEGNGGDRLARTGIDRSARRFDAAVAIERPELPGHRAVGARPHEVAGGAADLHGWIEGHGAPALEGVAVSVRVLREAERPVG